MFDLFNNNSTNLGVGFNIGLHFPGTDIYSSGSHSQQDVLIWVITYTIIYTIIPLLWLQKKGLSLGKLFTSFKWKRDHMDNYLLLGFRFFWSNNYRVY